MKRSEIKRIRDAVSRGETAYLEVEAEGKRYARRFSPRERLILLGAGHISQPVCHIGSLLGFDVTVVDDRALYANEERFPDAKEVICEEFQKAIQNLQITDRDFICVVTRGHRWDGDCLRVILKGTHPFYLGMIGSRRRITGLYDVLEEEGYDRKVLEAIHAPIGLSIKAKTPEEIAISICGELVLHRRSAMEKEPDNILEQTEVNPRLLEFMLDDSEAKAMMLVLESTGSTPAKTGAMMAVDMLGQNRGTIGGGCSEGGAMIHARKIAGRGISDVLDVDMTNEVAEDEGMVCGGTMKVLIEDIE